MSCLYPQFFSVAEWDIYILERFMNFLHSIVLTEFDRKKNNSHFNTYSFLWPANSIFIIYLNFFMKIFILRLQPFLWSYHEICWGAGKKPKKPMENVSLTQSIWKSLAVSVLEPDSSRGNCELLPWRVLGVWVSALKDIDMQTEMKTARHEGHVVTAFSCPCGSCSFLLWVHGSPGWGIVMVYFMCRLD